MRSNMLLALICCGGLATDGLAWDWPQWRGPNRDAKAADFTPPSTWPKELNKKWSTTVGDGVATPALVRERLYAFTRQGSEEVTTCLDAATGKVVWEDKYAADAVQGPASRYGGPRCSPAVAEGKICTLGVSGVLSCLDAATGKVTWRKDDFKAHPQFYTGSSPILLERLCIAQLGGRGNGGIVAYELSSGAEKWRWTGDGPAYGSPVLIQVGSMSAILTPTEGNLVAVNGADGKLLWQVKYSQGRYNAATPIVDGQTLIYAGPAQGMSAEKLENKNGQIEAKPLWKNGDNSLIYNTPVLKDGLLYGVSTTNTLFCIKADNGQTAWSVPLGGSGGQAAAPQKGEAPKGAPGKGFGGKGRGGGGGGGYGSVVDAGKVLIALTPAAELVVFQPSASEFKKIASYKVADGDTYAYPVVSGNRIYIKDKDAVTLWTIE